MATRNADTIAEKLIRHLGLPEVNAYINGTDRGKLAYAQDKYKFANDMITSASERLESHIKLFGDKNTERQKKRIEEWRANLNAWQTVIDMLKADIDKKGYRNKYEKKSLSPKRPTSPPKMEAFTFEEVANEPEETTRARERMSNEGKRSSPKRSVSPPKRSVSPPKRPVSPPKKESKASESSGKDEYGRFTIKNGKKIYTGPSGGKFTVKNGKKVYIKK